MKYFIPFSVSANINYVYFFCLLQIAEYNRETKRYDTIIYKSISELTNRINTFSAISISDSTISRFLREMEREEYKEYLSIDRKKKIITINNNYRDKRLLPFVVIDERALSFLIKQKSNLLCKYYLYLCYYCGISKTNGTNNTVKQFLDTCGYSTKSGNYISVISEFNSLLVKNQFIAIRKYKDKQGYERNIYTAL